MSGPKKRKSILSDHTMVGKRLVPPLMQIKTLTETSFRDTTLPHLVWIAALFNQSSDKQAVDLSIDFIKCCTNAIGTYVSPSLTFLGNHTALTDGIRTAIRTAVGRAGMLPLLQAKLKHQCNLLIDYPFKYLFDDHGAHINDREDVELLKGDVAALLDRHSLQATKIQATALVSMMATGKCFVSPSVNLPDFNAIFNSPESDESRIVAASVRALINTGIGLNQEHLNLNAWARDFWRQVFFLGKCQ